MIEIRKFKTVCTMVAWSHTIIRQFIKENLLTFSSTWERLFNLLVKMNRISFISKSLFQYRRSKSLKKLRYYVGEGYYTISGFSNLLSIVSEADVSSVSSSSQQMTLFLKQKPWSSKGLIVCLQLWSRRCGNGLKSQAECIINLYIRSVTLKPPGVTRKRSRSFHFFIINETARVYHFWLK